MTIEEALKILDTIPTIGEQVDALEMAIKALEQLQEKPEYIDIWNVGAILRNVPEQPDICKIYGGVCGYPIEACSECPKHEGWRPSKEQTRWIPCSERLPENTDPVSITWVNHDPESYYADIKDKPFTATGHYCNGKWWWYSVTCQDYLAEYGRCDVDAMNDAIEVIAWMPLPQPYRGIKHTCSKCIIKDTDACSRGNTEADEVACEDFVGGETDAK